MRCTGFPPAAADSDPLTSVSVIYDNRRRIATRLKQLRTGKRYAQAPPSNLRRLISNIEILGGRADRRGSPRSARTSWCWSPGRAAPSCGAAGPPTGCAQADGDLRLAYKKVVLVDNDQPLPTLGFSLI